MKKVLSWFAIALATFFAGAQLVRPEKNNPSVDAGQALESHVNVPPEVGAVLKRACSDCHSNQTRWPWYSNVAPASWYVVDHVNHGRTHLNFSTWSNYDKREAEEMLDLICHEVKSGAMPMESYLILHPDAKLSEGDVKMLCDWSSAESSRLASTELTQPSRKQ